MTGAVPGTLEAYLALRGLRTLPVRMERHQHNAMIIAQRLSDHAAVEAVMYPGASAFHVLPTPQVEHAMIMQCANPGPCWLCTCQQLAETSMRMPVLSGQYSRCTCGTCCGSVVPRMAWQ